MARLLRFAALLPILLLLTTASTDARIITVPSDQPTLADAFIGLAHFDTVYIQPGVYSGTGFEGLIFGGSSPVSPLANVTVAAFPDSGGVTIQIGEETTFMTTRYCFNFDLRDLVFEGGYRAIECSYNAHVRIANCTFDGCDIGIWGSVAWTGGVVTDSRFIDNDYGMNLSNEANWEILGCGFSGCMTGIKTDYMASPTLTNCVIHNCVYGLDNASEAMMMEGCVVYDCLGGVLGVGEYSEINNNLIMNNTIGIANARLNWDETTTEINCNDIWGNDDNYVDMTDLTGTSGNISFDPLLCDSAAPYGSSPLQLPLAVNPLSPCLPENNDCGVSIGGAFENCDCCRGIRGNVDYDLTGGVDIGDLTLMINHLFISFEDLPCETEADVTEDSAVDIGDLTLLINHLFITFEALPECE